MNVLVKDCEKRMFKIDHLNVRSMVDESNDIIVEGYGSVFNVRTLIGEMFYEEIAPGTFVNDLSSGRDVRCLFNHNWDYVLGRVSANTLELEEDSKGLKFRVVLPNTSYAIDLSESMRRGDIGECSFLFRTVADEWDYSQDIPSCRILEAELYEVSIVTLPAYEEATASLRSKTIIENNLKRQKILNRIGDYTK